jgi:uncharacterized protein involved in type VI secretion and phage assembly
MDEQMVNELLERVRTRFYCKYRGVVTEVDGATLRLKAKVPAVLGTQPTGWCRHCVPYAGQDVGMVFLPEPGSGVWIEFEGGDVSYPIWTGCYWRDGEIPSDATQTVKAIVTAGKLKILIDDGVGSLTITDNNQNKITLDATGITLERGANKVEIGDAEVNVNDGALEVV